MDDIAKYGIAGLVVIETFKFLRYWTINRNGNSVESRLARIEEQGKVINDRLATGETRFVSKDGLTIALNDHERTCRQWDGKERRRT